LAKSPCRGFATRSLRRCRLVIRRRLFFWGERSDPQPHMPRLPFNEVQYDRYTTAARGRTSQGQSAAQSAGGILAGPSEACFESRRSGALAGTHRHI
jgi:hypothetical protein